MHYNYDSEHFMHSNDSLYLQCHSHDDYNMIVLSEVHLHGSISLWARTTQIDSERRTSRIWLRKHWECWEKLSYWNWILISRTYARITRSHSATSGWIKYFSDIEWHTAIKKVAVECSFNISFQEKQRSNLWTSQQDFRSIGQVIKATNSKENVWLLTPVLNWLSISVALNVCHELQEALIALSEFGNDINSPLLVRYAKMIT